MEETVGKLDEFFVAEGFECHPFKIGWYNDLVTEIQPVFELEYPYDTLAFIVISTPKMFEKSFKPFVCRQECLGKGDLIDELMRHKFNLVKESFPEEDIECLHDFELHHSRRPKVLVQTAGHVAGAAYYYQRKDVKNDPWTEKKKIFGVSMHPKYGGWFALRGVLIFKNIQCENLEKKEPQDVVCGDEKRIELLERFNGNWQDWTYRDVVPVEDRYSDEQKVYFETLPKDRKHLVEAIRSGKDIS